MFTGPIFEERGIRQVRKLGPITIAHLTLGYTALHLSAQTGLLLPHRENIEAVFADLFVKIRVA